MYYFYSMLHPYTVTQTDYHGTDYTATMYLTREQARDRIVDGRLITPAAGRARNYQRLWGSFKSLAWSEGGRTDTGAWVSRNVIKQQEDEYGK